MTDPATREQSIREAHLRYDNAEREGDFYGMSVYRDLLKGYAAAVTQADKLACVRRELAMRINAYPRFVARGKMKQDQADREIAVMREILLDYEASTSAAQVAETYYRTIDEAHEVLRANVRSIGAKIGAAIRGNPSTT